MSEILDDFLKDEPKIVKTRHGCVTVWLSLMIIMNSLVALFYFFKGDSLPDIATPMLLSLGIIGILNVIFAIHLLKYKKLGFWGYIATSIYTFLINLTIGVGFGHALLGLISIGILYTILQIKQNSYNTWEQLE